nr:olfactory receptor 76 [Gregopimpla kuwanae]
MCFTMSCVVLNFCRDHLTNLDLLTKSIGIMGSYLSAVLKVICFLVNRKELMELHQTLEKYFDETFTCDPEVRIGIFDSLSIFIRPSFAITILVFIGTLVFFLTPLIVLFVQYSHDVHPLKYILPYPGKYPWIFEGGGFVYYVHYSWEILAGLYLFCVTSGVDSLFGYYVFQIHAIFRMMSHRMRNLSSDDEDYGATIRDCVYKHRMLGHCKDLFQKIYGPIVLWMFLTSAIIMCTLIFQASETPEMTIGYAILFTVYISMKLLQALMYAWYGGIVYTESEEFREAVYASGWPGSGDKTLMSNILIMMSHKPLVIVACKFLTVSTDMFANIVNATMSYFFLLQTLDEGN